MSGLEARQLLALTPRLPFQSRCSVEGSRASILSTVFKLAQGAEQRMAEIAYAEMIAKVITEVNTDSILTLIK